MFERYSSHLKRKVCGEDFCRMAESSYELLFSKLARARLFEMYFEEAGQVMASLILQPADDPRVDVTACV